MKIKPVFLLILGLFNALSVSATTAKWLVPPQYDTISYYSNDLFKCTKNGKIQLVDLSGRLLLPSEADSITDFSEGYALVLDREGKNLRIKGLFPEERGHRFIPVEGKYYASFYSHFSEGYLVVSDSTERFGYLNVNAVLVLNCQYLKARPFVKGWASVVVAKGGTRYINKQGKYLTIHGFHFGLLSQGTSFNEKGEALVCHTKKDGQKDFAVINTKGRVERGFSRTDKDPIREYDFAFDEEGKGFIPVVNARPSFDSTIVVFSSDGLYGYEKEEQTILPPQFAYAGNCADDCAIVALDGKYGIIVFVDGSFYASFDAQYITLRSGKPLQLCLTLDIPENINQDSLDVKLDNGSGELLYIVLDEDNSYTFLPRLDKKRRNCTIRIEVIAERLLLWEKTIEKTIDNKSIVDFGAPAKTTEYANADNLLTVKSTVSNNSNASVKVSVSFATPTFEKGSKNSVVSDLNFGETLAPAEKKEFVLTFRVENLETIKLTMTVKANQRLVGSKSANIVLKPFDL